MKIFRYITGREPSWRCHYMRLAMTCKRFMYLAERHYGYITKIKPSHPEYELHSFRVSQFPYERNMVRPKSTVSCPSHATSSDFEHSFWDDLSRKFNCKLLIFGSIKMRGYNLKKATCMLPVDDSRFDNITCLHLSYC